MLGGTAAFGLGAALLAGLVLVLALAMFDRQRLAQIEGWEEVTAVGDRAYFVPPSASAAPAVVKWDAGVWKVTASEPEKMRDTQMRRVGRDEATGVTIYTSGECFYVKTAPGEYLPAVK
jgi:hypothetical protein